MNLHMEAVDISVYFKIHLKNTQSLTGHWFEGFMIP